MGGRLTGGLSVTGGLPSGPLFVGYLVPEGRPLWLSLLKIPGRGPGDVTCSSSLMTEGVAGGVEPGWYSRI